MDISPVLWFSLCSIVDHVKGRVGRRTDFAAPTSIDRPIHRRDKPAARMLTEKQLRSAIEALTAAARAGVVGDGPGLELLAGRDLREGFARALSAQLRPDALVVLSDGQTPWPAVSPGRPTVIGLLPRAGAYRNPPPSWARVVSVGGG